MKIVAGLALGGALTVGSWLNGSDPHATVTGLPGAEEWPAAVAEVAPGASAPDPGSAPPQEVRAFFDRLTEPQLAALARRAPGVVGNLDGVPSRLRYAANAHASGEPHRQLLGYDPRGDGHAIEVLGDLESARHIAVIVPGSGWRLDNLLADGPERAHPARAAKALRDQLDPAADVAMVLWVGYDTPEAVDRQAARSERAMAGAPRLARLLDALPAHAHVTVLCHSYGAVVCGLAAPQRPVGDVVALAAPGMDVDSAAHVPIARRVWAARTAGDHIRFVPSVRVGGYGHRADPVDSDFGARVFRTGNADGHDGYYRPGSESLANLARIVVGDTAEVTLVHDPR
jgi:hypothetical protein